MKLQVAIMFGGMSCEHEISIISANQAMNALDTEKYELIPVYISKQQYLYTGELLKELKNYSDLDEVVKRASQVTFVRSEEGIFLKSTETNPLKFVNKKIDVVIPVVHGTNSEDGVLQGYLEMLQIPYAGCDIAAAAMGQDKVFQKACLAHNGISVSPSFWVYASQFDDNKEHHFKKAEKIGYPLIVKPANLGSSIGIQVAHNPDELVEVIEEAGQYDDKLLIEKVIEDLTEINCSVLGSVDDLQVSVLERVLKNDEILSFSDKYLGSSSSKGSKSKLPSKGASKSGSKGMASTTRVVPADINDKLTQKIQQMAKETFMTLGLSGVCRIDFMIDNTTGKVYVNEVNTIPGSLAFYLWAETGISFDSLMDHLIKNAIDKQRKKSKKIYTFDTNILQSYSNS